MIVQSHIIILDEIQPSPLPEIQLLLRENVLQTLVIRVHLTMISDEKMSPCLQCMHYDCLLQIMGSIIQLMGFKLS